MSQVEVGGFVSFTLAIVLLFVGKGAIRRSRLLQRYSIPDPVIGGFLCAAVVATLYLLFERQVTFELEVRDWLLLYFFAGIGLRSDLRTLLSGGRPMIILILLAATYILLQNLTGMGVAALFGMDARTGLMAGSISLTGGVGTTVAWGPLFVEELGITNAVEIGVACNTVGLIAACVIGGPIASSLIKRHQLSCETNEELDIGIRNQAHQVPIDANGILWAWLWLNVTLILGYGLDQLLKLTGVQLPMFVACLMAGIVVGNLRRLRLFTAWSMPGEPQAGAVISDICLGMFLTMALMNLKIWELQGALGFLAVVMTLQILLSVGFTIWLVFRLMGKDYEAAVICSGFGGITLGSTATAVVNMTAVAQQYGPAHRAFILVPLVCGFFIDLINAGVINLFLRW